jgi:hypothetical protein
MSLVVRRGGGGRRAEQTGVLLRRPWAEGGGRAVPDSKDLVVPLRLRHWQTSVAAAQATYHRHGEDLRQLQWLVSLPCGCWEG